MENRNLKPGDVVCLKSGGPKMTVTKIEDFAVFEDITVGREQAECTWFDGNNKETARFELYELKLEE